MLALFLALIILISRLSGWVPFGLRPDPAAHAGPVTIAAADPGAAGIDNLLEPIRAKHKIPGMAAAVLRGGNINLGVAGVRRAGSTERITLDDAFHLGSDTKAMTATLIAMLIEDGKLSWSTTIGDIFGDTVMGMDPAWKPVTIEQLLTHRGGAPANLEAGGLWGRLRERKGTPTRQRMELVEDVLSHSPEATPGARYIYSNAGYAIAGAMAETITGRPWEDLMQDRLFKPLGIGSAGFGAPGMTEKADQPWGHTSSGKSIAPGPRADNPPAIGPAGIVHMSIPDWARFIALHLRGDAANPNHEARLLQPDTFTRLHTPASGPGDPYAPGWLVAGRDWAKGNGAAHTGRVLTHAGSNTLWFCVVWIAPERDFAVLVASNQGGDEAARACDDTAWALIQKYLLGP
jgi:CubicO group peptidase (beta-lactamase class C family)